MDMIRDNFTAISKLIGEKQAELARSVQGITANSRRQAVEIVCQSLNERPTPEELETWLARERNAIKRGKPQAETANGKTMVSLYEQWCWQNDHVASDTEIAYWTGTSRQAVSNGRARAKEKGFEFTAAGHERWKVTRRPAVVPLAVAPVAQSEDERVASIVAMVLKQLQK